MTGLLAMPNTQLATAPDLPPQTSRRAMAANDTVESQQVEQAHQQFAALDHIGHTLGLQRMHQPKQRNHARQPRRCFTVTRAQSF